MFLNLTYRSSNQVYDEQTFDLWGIRRMTCDFRRLQIAENLIS